MQTVYHHIAWINYLIGDFSLALEYTDKALAESLLLRDESERKLSTASTYNIIAAVKTRTGQMEESYQYYKKSEKIFTDEDDLSGLGTVYNNCVNYFHEKGDFIRCIEYLEKSLEIATRTGSALSEAISSFNLGAEYLGLGKYDMARMYFDRYQKLNKLINNKLGQGWAGESYARLYWEEDDPDRALESIDTAIRIFAEVQSKIKEMGALLTKADFFIELGRYDEASALLAEVEEYALKNSLVDYIISIDVARGELLLRKNMPAEALAEFRKAEEKVRETDSLSALREIYFRMGQAMEKLGDSGYREYISLAKKMLTETAENIADNDLRHAYLSRPFNREILNTP
jgi:tetratricopeptide (TPR) repeat protein